MFPMGLFKPRSSVAAASVQSSPQPREPWIDPVPSGAAERSLYRALRHSVPIIDAAIYKLRRLIGEFTVTCPDPKAEAALQDFCEGVQVGAASRGMQEFIGMYLESLLTYGTAVGEIVMSGGQIAGLYNADLEHLELTAPSPLETRIAVVEQGRKRPCPYPELLLVSALNPQPGSPWGVSILRGLPFVSEVLMKVYRTVGVNWDRLGNVRFAVTCKPGQESGFSAADRARQMAAEWKKAMRSREVSDFVAVGDVSIKAIGSDNQLLDSDVPVRQMLEQIVAKLGLPPFLLGLNWSSTERMSSQQADVLTSELEAYRRLLTPVVKKIASTWLLVAGYSPECRVEWDEITMQDEVDHANARYLTARAMQLEKTLKEEDHE